MRHKVMKLCAHWWRPIAEVLPLFRLEEIAWTAGFIRRLRREDGGHVIRILEFAAAARALVHLSYFPRPGFGMCRSRPLSAISQSAAIRNRHAALTWALRRRSKPHKDIYCRRSRASSPGRRFDAQNVRMVSPRTTARSNILKDLIC